MGRSRDMKAEILAASDELMSAVLNGVYQGIILTVLVYLVLRLIGRTNAATRYWAWGATLVLVMAIIPAHYFRHRLSPDNSFPTIAGREPQPASDRNPVQLDEVPAPAAPFPDPLGLIDRGPVLDPEPGTLPEANPIPVINPDGESQVQADSGASGIDQSKHTRAATLVGEEAKASRGSRSEISETQKGSSSHDGWKLERFLNPVSWNLSSLAGFPKLTGVLLLLSWLSILVFKVGVLCGRLYQIRRIKETALPAGPELTGLFARLRADLAVGRPVDLKLCPVPASPVALGFFHPLILLPEEYANGPEAPEAEQILRHELAHVRRYDDWANLAQNFLQAVLFFHPAVWWINKRLSLEREIACDDYVLQRGAGPRAYALLLADLAGRLKRQDLVFAQGVSSSKSQLQQRINMILNTRRNTSPGLAKARLGFVTASAALISLLALYAAPRVVLAQALSASPAPAPVPARVGAAVVVAAPAAAPVAIVASEDAPPAAPTAEALPGVGAGPKFKPDQPDVAALPPVPAAPAAGVLPAMPPTPSVEIAGDMRPMGVPRPPEAPGALGDGSVEDRLARLEKMVQSLMDQQGPKRHGAMILRGNAGVEAFQDQKRVDELNDKINEMAKRQAERAHEQAARAQEQAKRAAEMAERANKDSNFKWKAQAEEWQKGNRQEGLAKQLEALQKAREGLQRQVENLDRQIERVERDRDRMQEQQERRSELQQEQEESQEETASVAESDKK